MEQISMMPSQSGSTRLSNTAEIEKQQKILNAKQEFLNQLSKGYSEQDAYIRTVKIATGDNNLSDNNTPANNYQSITAVKTSTPEEINTWLNLISTSIETFEKLKNAIISATPAKTEESDSNPHKIDLEF